MLANAHPVATVRSALANIPLITIGDEEFESIKTGMKISLDTDSTNLIHYQ